LPRQPDRVVEAGGPALLPGAAKALQVAGTGVSFHEVVAEMLLFLRAMARSGDLRKVSFAS